LILFAATDGSAISNNLLGTGVKASVAGTTPVHRESFIIFNTIGHKIAKHDWNRKVGTGSTMEVAAFIFEISLQRE